MTEADQRFEACLDEVLRYEGGYADHPGDPGGATNLGITRATLAAWRGIAPVEGLDKREVKALRRSEAAAIYRKHYWDRCGGPALPSGVDLAVFDFAVNSGPDRAIRALQAAVKAGVDGLVGPKTLEAVKLHVAKAGAAALIDALCTGRMSFLQRLAIFATFGRGWTNRVTAVRKTALGMAGVSPTTRITTTNQRTNSMDILSGYRTYIVAGLMLLAGLAQLAGADLPTLDGHSAGQLLMEGLAILFLRRGMKGGTGKA